MAPPLPAPKTIFHAFHMPFGLVTKKVPELTASGFDAIQVSPAQKSSAGPEWWRRYQPQCYGTIEGLGTEADLGALCHCARAHGLMIIADCVFNHMLVVASHDEWHRAQRDAGLLEKLQQRLEAAVGPTFDRNDFQWPWRALGGETWDNDERYEGWGCGEWSELRDCPKVVDVHCAHLRQLLDCGVRGFRFDAVKHMRPAHLGKYVNFLRAQNEHVYIYGEVMSLDMFTHSEYTAPLGIPSTDFLACAVLYAAFHRRSISGIARGFEAACRVLDEGNLHHAAALLGAATLGDKHVAFTRNHDTVCNDPAPCGLDWTSEQAAAATAFLLALPGRTVLLLPEDAAGAAAAVRFRSLMAAAAPDARVESDGAGGAVLRVERTSCAGAVVGVALINPSDAAQYITFPCSSYVEVCTGAPAPQQIELAPRSARFFVGPAMLPQTREVELRVHYATKPGQDLHVAGSCPALGCWDLQKSVGMRWTENDVWVAKVVLEGDPAEPVRYKYAVVNSGRWQSAQWEEGNSHMLKVLNIPASAQLDDSWGIADNPASEAPDAKTNGAHLRRSTW
mmetsp:Transcript_55639/g.156640  ORF Transcript_55639/g.156640 Transcript_55639/m.156640 type:complete len:563 (+) Transcript_55639:91-1779(+)